MTKIPFIGGSISACHERGRAILRRARSAPCSGRLGVADRNDEAALLSVFAARRTLG